MSHLYGSEIATMLAEQCSMPSWARIRTPARPRPRRSSRLRARDSRSAPRAPPARPQIAECSAPPRRDAGVPDVVPGDWQDDRLPEHDRRRQEPVRRALHGQDRRLVDQARAPRKETEFFTEDFFEGTAQARALGAEADHEEDQAGQADLQAQEADAGGGAAPFFGTTTTFALQEPLKVKREPDRSALTVPTWAPRGWRCRAATPCGRRAASAPAADDKTALRTSSPAAPRSARNRPHLRLRLQDRAHPLLGHGRQGSEPTRRRAKKPRSCSPNLARARIALPIAGGRLVLGRAPTTIILGAAKPGNASCPEDCLVEAR